MKRSILFAAVLACLCLVVLSSCALFGSRQKTPAASGQANAVGPAWPVNGGSNQLTGAQGGITTTLNGGQGTMVPNGGATGPGGTGASADTQGDGSLFYLYVVFGAAIVIWIIWASWHSYKQSRHHSDSAR